MDSEHLLLCGGERESLKSGRLFEELCLESGLDLELYGSGERDSLKSGRLFESLYLFLMSGEGERDKFGLFLLFSGDGALKESLRAGMRGIGLGDPERDRGIGMGDLERDRRIGLGDLERDFHLDPSGETFVCLPFIVGLVSLLEATTFSLGSFIL